MNNEKSKILLRDMNFYGQKSCSPVNDCDIIWDRSSKANAKTVVFTDLCLDFYKHARYKNSFKVAWLLEPYEINRQIYDFVSTNHDKFDLILTHHLWFYQKMIVAGVSKDKVVPYVNGMTSVRWPEWETYPKTKSISIVASGKAFAEGHKLRHNLIESTRGKIDLFGKAFKYLQNKTDGLKDYRFSVAVENSSVDLYISEKIIDCFATGTVPIYWGAPGVQTIFNRDGILYCKTIDELILAVENAHKHGEKFFMEEKVQKAIKDNFEIAKKYAIPENWLLEHVFKPRGLV